jgi:hypothetical protein
MIIETRTGIPALAALVLFSALSGEFWPNLLSVTGAVILWAGLGTGMVLAMTKLGGWQKLRPSLLPKSLASLVALAVLSIALAEHRGMASSFIAAMLVLALAGIFLATTFSWPQLLAMLGRSTRLIIGLSLAFELVTAIFVRQGIQPVAGLSAGSEISRSNLFTDGAILGIVGNVDLLGGVAVLGAVALVLQLSSGTISQRRALGWGILLAGAVALSGSWAAIAALGATGLSWGALLLARRRAEGRRGIVAVGAVVVAITGIAALLSGTGVWHGVPTGLTAAASPVGLLLLVGTVISTAYRAWWLAVDRQRGAHGDPLPFAVATLLPPLVETFAVVYLLAALTAGLTEGLFMSWLLLVLVAVKSKQDAHSVALPLTPVTGRYRDLPLSRRPSESSSPII